MTSDAFRGTGAGVGPAAAASAAAAGPEAVDAEAADAEAAGAEAVDAEAAGAATVAAAATAFAALARGALAEVGGTLAGADEPGLLAARTSAPGEDGPSTGTSARLLAGRWITTPEAVCDAPGELLTACAGLSAGAPASAMRTTSPSPSAASEGRGAAVVASSGAAVRAPGSADEHATTVSSVPTTTKRTAREGTSESTAEDSDRSLDAPILEVRHRTYWPRSTASTWTRVSGVERITGHFDTVAPRPGWWNW